MPFLLLVSIVLIALSFGACNTGGQGSDRWLSDGATSESSPSEITMAVWELDIAHLEKAGRIYEEKTGIKANIQTYFVEPDVLEATIIDSSGSSYTTSLYVDPYADTSMYEQQTISALTTGNGADIYDVAFLEFEHLGRNGLLADMGDWIENGAEFAADNVFRNILLSGKTESGVFAVPIDFNFRRLHAMTPYEPLPENKRMTWQEFFAEVSELDYTQEIAYRGTDLDIFMYRFISRASDFIDEAGRNT
jgi:ABC-type glycerol-3-phosphate transport system substrate-binding protein